MKPSLKTLILGAVTIVSPLSIGIASNGTQPAGCTAEDAFIVDAGLTAAGFGSHVAGESQLGNAFYTANGVANRYYDRTIPQNVNVNHYYPQQGLDQNGRSTRTASGEIQNIWVEHNVNIANVNGMNLHASLLIYNNKGWPNELSFYFYKNSFWTGLSPLKDKDGLLRTSDGQVARTAEALVPSYESCSYKNVKVFMPYGQLDVSESGEHNLAVKAILWDKSNSRTGPRMLDESEIEAFSLNKP